MPQVSVACHSVLLLKDLRLSIFKTLFYSFIRYNVVIHIALVSRGQTENIKLHYSDIVNVRSGSTSADDQMELFLT